MNSCLVDTNLIIRFLTGEPEAQATRAKNLFAATQDSLQAGMHRFRVVHASDASRSYQMNLELAQVPSRPPPLFSSVPSF